eukprot:scaffold4897_cov154-Skeletonema_menzelii.AAC.1
MAEAARDDDEIFVYMGGDQRVPDRVRRARIHKSVKTVPREAFYNRHQLISVEFHDDIEIIEERAFGRCTSLRSIKLLGVRIIKAVAFCGCTGVTDVEFGDKLETIEHSAFNSCWKKLKNIKMPTVRTVGEQAFAHCYELSDVEFGEPLETLQRGVFLHCPKLKRIALPLKDNMIERFAFNFCPGLTAVDLVGVIHNTVASLHMESWRSEMSNEINRINQVLPTIRKGEKTQAIQQWMESAFRRLDHYKWEHRRLLKEATTMLELALWKANLADNGGVEVETGGQRERQELRVTSGASIVINSVLPFLQLME